MAVETQPFMGVTWEVTVSAELPEKSDEVYLFADMQFIGTDLPLEDLVLSFPPMLDANGKTPLYAGTPLDEYNLLEAAWVEIAKNETAEND
jgi:hypothetical protein